MHPMGLKINDILEHAARAPVRRLRMIVTFTTGPATLKWAATTDCDACSTTVTRIRCLNASLRAQSHEARSCSCQVTTTAHAETRRPVTHLEVQVREND